MINFYSKMEMVGRVVKSSSLDELESRSYGYARVLFKDKTNKAKFVNLYFWDDAKKMFQDLDIQKNDLLQVFGYLDHQQTEDNKNVYSIGVTYAKKLGRYEEKENANTAQY